MARQSTPSSMSAMSIRDQRRWDRNRRLRRVILAVTILCIGVSVTLNVMHAPLQGGIMAKVVAAAPPIGAFGVIELIALIPGSHIMLTIGRVLGSLVVGSVAAVVSYIQQIDYLHRLGYGGNIAAVFPAVIDGTMIVTTLSLVEVVRVLRQIEYAMDARLEEIERSTVDTVTAVPVAVDVPSPVPAETVTPDPAPVAVPTPPVPAKRKPRRRPTSKGHPGAGASDAAVQAAIVDLTQRDTPAEVLALVPAAIDSDVADTVVS
jgi:Protein of unknown function (DUF2637)